MAIARSNSAKALPVGATKTLVARFWAKVVVGSGDECWGWTAGTSNDGYGIIGIGHVVVGWNCIRAHRLSWMIHNGVIPEGKMILHHCDNPPCVNPKHLYCGTQSDNLKDAYKRNRHPINRGGAKLTEAKVLKIRELVGSSKMTQSEVARKLEMSTQAISTIILRETWRHI